MFTVSKARGEEITDFKVPPFVSLSNFGRKDFKFLSEFHGRDLEQNIVCPMANISSLHSFASEWSALLFAVSLSKVVMARGVLGQPWRMADDGW